MIFLGAGVSRETVGEAVGGRREAVGGRGGLGHSAPLCHGTAGEGWAAPGSAVLRRAGARRLAAGRGRIASGCSVRKVETEGDYLAKAERTYPLVVWACGLRFEAGSARSEGR